MIWPYFHFVSFIFALSLFLLFVRAVFRWAEAFMSLSRAWITSSENFCVKTALGWFWCCHRYQLNKRPRWLLLRLTLILRRLLFDSLASLNVMRSRTIRLTTLLWEYLWVDVFGINHFWSLPLHRNWLSLISFDIFDSRMILKVFESIQVKSISPFLDVFLPILVDLILVMMLHWVRYNKFTPISIVKVSSRLCKHVLELLFVFWL